MHNLHVGHMAFLKILDHSTVTIDEERNILHDSFLDRDFPMLDIVIELKEAGYVVVGENNEITLTPIGVLAGLSMPLEDVLSEIDEVLGVENDNV